MSYKGILLAGGAGTRLYPATSVISKQMLAVYDKPMIYYPLSALMLAGIREILIISTPDDLPRFNRLFGNGERLGMRFSYREQTEHRGLADAFIIGRDFVGTDQVAMALGDNIFYGHGLSDLLIDAAKHEQGATIFCHPVKNPSDYGVVTITDSGNIQAIDEKPEFPQSNLAVTGIYFYDNDVLNIAENLAPSPRGELEITDINRTYLEQGTLRVEHLGRGFSWLDMGTFDSLLSAANFIATIEQRQALKVACIEEIAWRNGWINDASLMALAKETFSSGYGEYLQSLVSDPWKNNKKN